MPESALDQLQIRMYLILFSTHDPYISSHRKIYSKNVNALDEDLLKVNELIIDPEVYQYNKI